MPTPPPEDHRLQPDHLPTPFSAAQIRDASVPGTRVAFRIEPAGEEPHVDWWEFLESDAEGGDRRRWTETADGAVIEPPEVTRSPWIALQRHASYPAAQTVISSDVRTIGPGSFDCWLYTITDPESGQVTRAWFAPELPGPPIVLESAVGGVPVFRMELIQISRPG